MTNPPTMRQLPLALAPAAAPGLDDYLAGDNAAALQQLAALPARETAPVYLWGPSGCGKSHLLQALAGARRAAGAAVGVFGPDSAPPWLLPEGAALVVVDGCDALDAARQHAAFALFVEAQSQGVPWVAAGRLPPVDLPLREDLRTRLGWGLVFALQPLPESETRAVLRREAARRGITLGDEVIGHLLTRCERDLKHLMALLDRLDELALAERRAVTLPLLRRLLAEEPS